MSQTTSKKTTSSILIQSQILKSITNCQNQPPDEVEDHKTARKVFFRLNFQKLRSNIKKSCTIWYSKIKIAVKTRTQTTKTTKLITNHYTLKALFCPKDWIFKTNRNRWLKLRSLRDRQVQKEKETFILKLIIRNLISRNCLMRKEIWRAIFKLKNK